MFAKFQMYAIRRVSTTLLVNLTNEIIHDAALTSFTRAKRRKKGRQRRHIRQSLWYIAIQNSYYLNRGEYFRVNSVYTKQRCAAIQGLKRYFIEYIKDG